MLKSPMCSREVMMQHTLQGRIAGQVFQRGDEPYEQVRQAAVWNALKPARYPEIIVQVASDRDVIEAVRFARAQKMQVAIRGGGHSWCAPALRQDGMLLDLSQLN